MFGFKIVFSKCLYLYGLYVVWYDIVCFSKLWFEEIKEDIFGIISGFYICCLMNILKV